MQRRKLLTLLKDVGWYRLTETDGRSQQKEGEVWFSKYLKDLHTGEIFGVNVSKIGYVSTVVAAWIPSSTPLFWTAAISRMQSPKDTIGSASQNTTAVSGGPELVIHRYQSFLSRRAVSSQQALGRGWKRHEHTLWTRSRTVQTGDTKPQNCKTSTRGETAPANVAWDRCCGVVSDHKKGNRKAERKWLSETLHCQMDAEPQVSNKSKQKGFFWQWFRGLIAHMRRSARTDTCVKS